MSKRIESEKLVINCLPEKVFNFLGNFDNFTKLLPDQVENWQSTGDWCSFEVKGLAALGLRITEKIPYSRICMKGEGKLPFNFTIIALISRYEPQQCEAQLEIDSDMSHFIALMAEKPLKDFVDALIKKLKLEMEK